MSIRDSRRKRTRIAILEAAIELFLELSPNKGDAVRLEDIARRAGVSRRSIYVHFGSKPDLLVAMIQHFDVGGMLEHLVQRVVDAHTSRQALDAIAHLHTEYSPVAYPMAAVLMRHRHSDEALRAAWHDRMAARRTVYSAVVRRLQEDGLLASEWDVVSAVDVLSALTSWEVWEQLVVEQGWSKQRYRDYLRTVLERALVAATSP